ncbi:MAG: hypothetical protein L3V56_00460 [Candidatus Magnetoovum sp. WYHC-5]|nr:hypothetical protein [Candidatus Magnetoovum sp. WYHC-5]
MLKKLIFLFTTIFVTAFLTTTVFAGGWERCKLCHRDSGKPALSKASLIKKYPTAQALVAGALATSNYQMEFVRYNEDLVLEAATELGLKGAPALKHKADVLAGAETIDAKKLVETKCVTCHNINRIVYAPKYTVENWLHIISTMEKQTKGMFTVAEMAAIAEWLYANHDKLTPTEIQEQSVEALKKVPAPVRDILVKNKCIMCHTDERLITQAAAWTSEDWQHVIERMRQKAPSLLHDVDSVDLANHLFDSLATIPKSGAKKITSQLYYKYSANAEIWGERQGNYYLNKGIDQDQGRRRLTGFFEAKGNATGEIFNPDKWKAYINVGLHTMMNPGNDSLEDGLYRRVSHDVNGDITLEEAWVELVLSQEATVRAGIQEYNADLIGTIYNDTDPGVRVYGTVGNGIQWSLFAAQRFENNLISDLNVLGDIRDQHIVIANAQFNVGKTLIKPTLIYNHDREGDHKYGRSGYDEKIDAVYGGVTTYGPVGPLQVLTGLYGAVGMQDNVMLLGTVPLEDQDIRAFMGYADIAYPLNKSMITPHIGVFYASGDDNPGDDDAEGFDSISDKVNVWGSKGIIIDDRISLPGGVTVVRNNSPYTSLRDNDDSSNFVNPGVLATNLGLVVVPHKKLNVDTNLTYFWWAETQVLEAIFGDLDREIGLEWNMLVDFTINKNLTVFAGGAAFWPENEMNKIFGDDSVATNILGGVKIGF